MYADDFDCDFCGRTTDMALRRPVCQPRPSDPTELVATLWLCPACGDKMTPPLPDVWYYHDRVEQGLSFAEFGNRTFMFVTI
jgi:rubredoxin